MLKALGWKAHRDAGAEVLTIALISILPLLFGAMVRWLQVENPVLSLEGYEDAFNSFVIRGELFFYALAFIAVIAWVALKEWPPGLRPPRVVLGLFCMISFGIITTFYTLDTVKVALHTDAVLIASKIMFVVSLMLYYFATVLIKAEPPDFAAALSASSNALASQLGEGQHHD